MVVFIAAVLSALGLSFLCSISEAVVLRAGYAQVEALGASRSGRIFRQFKRQLDLPLAAILLVRTPVQGA